MAHPLPAATITAEALRRLRERPFILDVRTLDEVKAHVAIHSSRNIPLGELPGRLNELPADQNTPIVVHCAAGSRSAMATLFLRQVKGYTHLQNLQGGFAACKRLHP